MSIPMIDDYKFEPQGDSPVDLSGREGAPREPEQCDIDYNVGWVDAVGAAVKIVNDARFDGTTDLREVRARIEELKRHAKE